MSAETPQQPELSSDDRQRFKKWIKEFSNTSNPESVGIDDAFDAVFEYATLHERARIIERAKTICEILRNADPKIFPTLIIRAEAIEDFIDATFGIKIRKQ